jgi:predicted nucleotidyltransferase
MHQGIYVRTNACHQGNISMAENYDDVKKIVTNFLEEVRKKYSIDVAYLFGSYAKGTSNKWSDIDIAIVSSDFLDDLFEERLNLMQLAASIDDRIEPKPFKTELFDLNDPLVDEIQKYGIQLF